jgi:hypothetical protein
MAVNVQAVSADAATVVSPVLPQWAARKRTRLKVVLSFVRPLRLFQSARVPLSVTPFLVVFVDRFERLFLWSWKLLESLYF